MLNHVLTQDGARKYCTVKFGPPTNLPPRWATAGGRGVGLKDDVIRSLISANVSRDEKKSGGKRDNVKEMRADGKEAFYMGRWEKGGGDREGDVGKEVRRRREKKEGKGVRRG